MHELTITGPCPARRILLNEGVHGIGRVSSNAIHLDGDGISREHARIEIHGGEAIVEDLESLNGTQVGGRSIRRHRLEDGDVIGVGRYRLLYRRTGTPADMTELADADELERRIPRSRDEEAEAEDLDPDTPAPSAAGAGRLVVASRPRLVEPPQWSGGSSGKEAPEGAVVVALPQKRRARKGVTPESRAARGQERPERPPVEGIAAPPARGRLRVNFRGPLAGVLLGIVAFAVLLIGMGVSTLAEEMMAIEAQSRARTLVYLLAEMNAAKLRDGEVRLLTEPVAAETGVKRAVILDENGLVLAPEQWRGQTDPVLRGAHASPAYLRQVTAEGAALSVPMTLGSRRVGTAVLDFSVDYLKEKTGHMGKLVLLLGLFLGAVALLCSTLLDRMFHRPFVLLASEVDLVTKQDLRGEVPATTDSRANQLVAALNRLVQRAVEQQRGAQARQSPVRAVVSEAGLEGLRELSALLAEGVLVVAEDGTLELWNDAAGEILGCELPQEHSPHVLDALSGYPQLGALLALLKEARKAPGEVLSRSLPGARPVEVRACAAKIDRRLLSIVALEPSV